MIYPNAIKIARPEYRELMPQYAQVLKFMQDWCSKYVVDHWAYDDATFSFFYEEDYEVFKERFKIKEMKYETV